MALRGWGRSSLAETEAARPERRGEVEAALADREGGATILAYGAGRSYGDVALNGGGATILTGRLDRMIEFSEDTGLLVCEPGVAFRDLTETFLVRGWAAPVSPGTAFATIGGAIANDVHGKNHISSGSFGDHVAWFDLALADGSLVRVSPDSDPELFRATIGGLGLTGVITLVAFRMARISSSNVIVSERRTSDLAGTMAALVAGRDATYSVAWIDALSSGAALGRGIVEIADHASAGHFPPPKRREKRFPVDLPAMALNPVSIGLFNRLYYRRVPEAGRERTLDLPSFLYPLDAILEWNRMYGKRGFFQFQCVLPEAQSETGMRELLRVIGEAKAASFLAVLKLLGREGQGFLSFPQPGFTLALDFPTGSDTRALLSRLEAITLEHGGRIYLAKDACLSPEGFRRMYPALPRFEAVLDRVDPGRRFCSDMARRLQIRGAGR